MTTEKDVVGILRENQVSKILLNHMYIQVQIPWCSLIFYCPQEDFSKSFFPLLLLVTQPIHYTNAIPDLLRTTPQSIKSGSTSLSVPCYKGSSVLVIGYVWCKSSVHIGTTFIVLSFSTSLTRHFTMDPPPSVSRLTSISWHQGHTHSVHISPQPITSGSTTLYVPCWEVLAVFGDWVYRGFMGG